MDKGFREAVEASQAIRSDCHLYVYGPVMADTDVALLTDNPAVTYGAVLRRSEVPHVLSDHDVLRLPTYWASEGYPGVLSEAFQCGIPVIASRWAGIPEIVEHEKNGLLVEPRSSEEVRRAIERLVEDPQLYREHCDGAFREGNSFGAGFGTIGWLMNSSSSCPRYDGAATNWPIMSRYLSLGPDEDIGRSEWSQSPMSERNPESPTTPRLGRCYTSFTTLSHRLQRRLVSSPWPPLDVRAGLTGPPKRYDYRSAENLGFQFKDRSHGRVR